MPRPVMLGIVGDSGSGKTTITRGLVRVLGEDQVTHFSTDDYHRFDRRQRAERNITPLHPDCNHLDILAQHLRHLHAREPIMKPVYRHTGGTFAPPDYFVPGRFLVAEGLLAFFNREVGLASALAVVLMVLVLVCILPIQWLARRGADE